jgi:chromosome segregation ATPase
MSEEPTRPHDNGAATLSDVVAQLHTINARLQNLEDKFDARSRDTQPMSERINQILSEVAATRHELREVNRTLRRMNVDLATALRNQDDLEDRISNLEAPRQ